MIERPNKSDTLSYDEMQFLIEILINSVNIELARIINEKDRIVVSEYLTQVYVSAQYFTFFIPQSLEIFTESVMGSAPVRDFMLNLTARVSMVTCYNHEAMDRLIKTIVSNVCQNQPIDYTYSLIAKEINDSISINADALTNLLRNNFWILLMHLLTFHLHDTDLFKDQ